MTARPNSRRSIAIDQPQWTTAGNLPKNFPKVGLYGRDAHSTGDIEVNAPRDVCDLLHQADVGTGTERDGHDFDLGGGGSVGLSEHRRFRRRGVVGQIRLTIGHHNHQAKGTWPSTGDNLLAGDQHSGRYIRSREVMSRLPVSRGRFDLVKVRAHGVLQNRTR